MSIVCGAPRKLRAIRSAWAVFALLGLAAPAAQEHSLKALEDQLGNREQYFQPIDKPAPAFTLRDAKGQTVALAGLKGKVVVLHFIYTSCPDVCPLHAEKIAEVQALVNRTPMKDQVRFVTITTDPTRDTLDVLQAYGPLHGLDPVNWIFLTSLSGEPEDATRNLAERFGHIFTKTDDGYQMHGVVTHVIDREGRWRANFHGLKFGSTNLVLYVNALVNDHDHHDHAPPTEHGLWSRLRDML
jgi:protein SCO1/2